jgi:MoaA/NifB/PqqE/SkfB family radical SAM enzyme
MKTGMAQNIDIKTSFTAADSIPLKVLLDRDLISHIERKKKLLPLHIQFLPTNRCNLNCSFCSCSARDRKLEMDINLARKIIAKCRKAGTKSVTITGGGEPLMYPAFSELIESFRLNSIKVGLVTNGLLLHKVPRRVMSKITWCRISNDDSRRFVGVYKKNLAQAVKVSPGVDWAFSHVVSLKPNFDEIARIVRFANEHDFTHVRLVADLFQPEGVNMERVKRELRKRNVDDSKVVYQERKAYERGGDCFIGYLKPLIGPDARVYACCGVQYAFRIPSKDLPRELCLGDALRIDSILRKSDTPLNGSKCVKCYYMNYNILLRGMLKSIVHREFV